MSQSLVLLADYAVDDQEWEIQGKNGFTIPTRVH